MEKKRFASELCALARKYENDEMINAVRSAEVDRNFFLNLIRTFGKGSVAKSLAMKGEDGVVLVGIKTLNKGKAAG